MPIRAPRGRAAAYRGVWQWPLRSPARLAVTVVAVVAVGVGVSLGVAALAGDRTGGLIAAPGPTTRITSGPVASRAPASASVVVPTALPPVPELTPTTLPVSQAPAVALTVVRLWTAAWVRPPDGTTSAQWLDGLRSTTTAEYLGVLSGVDPANVPATRVVGEPRVVRVASRSVQAEVVTDASTLLVTVVDTESGWRVSGYDRA